MTVLQFFNEFRPLELVDNVVNRWAKIVVPIYIRDPNSNHRVLGYGSAFIVERNRAAFLVTVLHVLVGIKDGEALLANIGGKAVLLNGLSFVTSAEDDLAVAFLDPSWVEKQKLERVFSLPLDAPAPSWKRFDIFVLLGYPGSRNKLNKNTNDVDRRLFSYSSSQRIENPQASTHIRNPVAFHFDKKAVTDTDENKINVGAFNGNSGGPVLEVRARNDGYGTIKLSTSLAGVFVGWDKHHKELLCIRPEIVKELIDGLA